MNIDNKDSLFPLREGNQVNITTEEVNSPSEQAYHQLEAGLKSLEELANTINLHQQQWFSAFRGLYSNLNKFNQEVQNFNESMGKNFSALNEEDKEKLQKLAATSFGALESLKKNHFITRDIKLSQKLSVLKIGIKHQFKEAPNLYNLFQFSETCRQFKSLPESSGQVVTVIAGQPTFIPVTSMNQEKMTEAKNYFENVSKILSNKNVVQHMSVEQMMDMEMMISWQYVNFLSLMPKGMDYNESILFTLKNIRCQLHESLGERDPSDFAGLLEGDKAYSYLNLQQQIQKQFYSEKFWSDPMPTMILQKHEENIKSYIGLIGHPERHEQPGLTFVASNDEAGIAVYTNDEGHVVISSFGGDSYGNYINPLQDRDAELLVGGMVHKPVVDKMIKKKAMATVQKILKEEKLEGKPIITVGFGIDGAVAQLIGFRLAKDYQNTPVLSFGVGVAPFLDRNSAATVKNHENFKAINFHYASDTNLKTGFFSPLVAKGYSNEQEDVYPIYNPDKFISDVTGHDKQNYLNHIETAVDLPRVMFDMNNRLSEILRASYLNNEEQCNILHQIHDGKE